jgi:hypothetical protein
MLFFSQLLRNALNEFCFIELEILKTAVMKPSHYWLRSNRMILQHIRDYLRLILTKLCHIYTCIYIQGVSRL